MDKRRSEWLLTFPSFGWLVAFFLIPTLIVFAYAFRPFDIEMGLGQGWTVETIKSLANPSYLRLIFRTLWLSVLTTAISILLAVPVGYQLAAISKRWRHLLLLMIVMPFWSSFLIRIFAWKTLLHPEGFLKKTLMAFHLIDSSTSLLYNYGSVLLVMVYTYLPFAILPIYAAASKFNFQLIEAAMDLGASRTQTFFQVFIPGIQKGILSAMVMVFVPAIGAYVIPDLVGGTSSEMIGNRIAQRTFADHNLPQASALSALLALIILIPLIAVALYSTRTKPYQLEAANRE